MKNLFLTTILFFCMLQIFGQEILSIPLRTELMVNGIPRSTSPIIFRPDHDGYSGIPTDMDSIWVGREVFQRDQYWYNELLKKDSLESYYRKMLIANKMDTLKLSTKFVKCYVGIMSGIKGNKKRIIVDTNNNNNFSDDATFEYDMTDSTYLKDRTDLSYFPTQTVSFETFENGEIFKKTTQLKVRPFVEKYTYKINSDLRRAVYVTRYYYKHGNFRYNGNDYKLSVAFMGVDFNENFGRALYNISPVDQLPQYGIWLRKGIKYHIDQSLLEVVANSSGSDTLFLKAEKATERTIGWQLGDYTSSLYGNTIEGNYINIDKTYRYQNIIILDFWGSWCAPCIEEIPKLKELYVENPTLNLMSVNVEYNMEGIERAKKIINEEKMNWLHIPEIWSEDGGIKDKLAVNDFPTLIVINKDGKIIFREKGLGSVEKLKGKLQEFLKSSKL